MDEEFLKVARAMFDAKGDSDKLRDAINNIPNDKTINLYANSIDADRVISDINRRLDSLDGRTITTYISTVTNGNQMAGGYRPTDEYATGGTVNSDGVYLTNEKGVELIDSVSGNEAMAVGYSAEGILTRMSSNTRVTNSLMTTEKMKAQVQKEVNNQVNIELRDTLRSEFSALATRLSSNKETTIVKNDFTPVIKTLKEGFEKLGYDINNIDLDASKMQIVMKDKVVANILAPEIKKINDRKDKNRSL